MDNMACACSMTYENDYRYADGTVAHMLQSCPILKNQREAAYTSGIPRTVDDGLYGKRVPETVKFLETTNAGRNPMHRETTYNYDVERQERLDEDFEF